MLDSLKKDELVELADSMGLDSGGTKDELLSAIQETIDAVDVDAVMGAIEAASTMAELAAAVDGVPALIKNTRPVAPAVTAATRRIVGQVVQL